MTESETKFNKMLDEYVRVKVPRKKMTASQWSAFEKTSEGKEYWNRWDLAKEEFYRMAVCYLVQNLASAKFEVEQNNET